MAGRDQSAATRELSITRSTKAHTLPRTHGLARSSCCTRIVTAYGSCVSGLGGEWLTAPRLSARQSVWSPKYRMTKLWAWSSSSLSQRRPNLVASPPATTTVSTLRPPSAWAPAPVVKLRASMTSTLTLPRTGLMQRTKIGPSSAGSNAASTSDSVTFFGARKPRGLLGWAKSLCRVDPRCTPRAPRSPNPTLRVVGGRTSLLVGTAGGSLCCRRRLS